MSATSAAAAVLAGLDGLRSGQEEFYRDLHAHPELSHSEHRTAGRVADALDRAGHQVHTGVGGTGVVGLLGSGDLPTISIRSVSSVRTGNSDGQYEAFGEAVRPRAAGWDLDHLDA